MSSNFEKAAECRNVLAKQLEGMDGLVSVIVMSKDENDFKIRVVLRKPASIFIPSAIGNTDVEVKIVDKMKEEED